MNRVRQIGLAFVLLAGGLATPAAAQPQLPAFSAGPVYDGADIVPADDERQINARLREINARTGRTVIVVTVPGLGTETIEAYSGALLGAEWGAGAAEVDQRLLMLIAPNQREMRIEVGRGLQRYVTTPIAARIIRERITPRFQRNDFAGGINTGLYALTEQFDREPAEANTVAEPAATAAAAEPGPMRGRARTWRDWSALIGLFAWLAMVTVFWAVVRRQWRGRS